MVDVKKMKQRYAESKRGGDFWNADEGNTLAYIHGQTLPDDDFPATEGLNYMPVVVHYGVGKNNQMVICLDAEANPVIKHPYIQKLLKKFKKKINFKSGCPVCREIAEGGMDEDEADRSRAQTRYLWGITPMFFRADPADEWRKLTPKPSVTFQGKTIYDGLMELYCDNGDISDLEAAVLANIYREGRGRTDTKYKVTADARTIRKPLELKGALAKAIQKAVAPGGDCDLFKLLANMMKTNAEAEAAVSGIKVDVDDDDDDMEPAAPDDDDTEATEEPEAEEPEAEEPEAEDDAEEPEAGAEDEPDDEAELELPEPPKPKPKAAKKAAAKKGNGKAKPKKVEAEEPEAEEDDGLDDLAAQLEGM